MKWFPAAAPAFISALAGCALVLVAFDLRAASARLEARRRAHHILIGDAEQILLLRSQRATVLDNQRPESDLLRLITTAIDDAHLDVQPQMSAGTSTGVPATDRASAARTVRQTVAVSLAGLSLQQVGAFLHAFHQIAGPWRCADIGLNAETAAPDRIPAYMLRLTLVTDYVTF